jgi:hypothetical protein
MQRISDKYKQTVATAKAKNVLPVLLPRLSHAVAPVSSWTGMMTKNVACHDVRCSGRWGLDSKNQLLLSYSI